MGSITSSSWPVPSLPNVGVVVVAAGSGRRMGGAVPKQFLSVAGVPLVLRALRPFLSHPEVHQVVVVLPAADLASPPEWLAPLLGHRLTAVAGGEQRMDSVERGLAALSAEVEIVLVHDGARPFPRPEVIDGVIAAARQGYGALAAVPVTDTLKEAGPSSEGRAVPVRRTVPRDGLWRAQTPQGFPRSVLTAAFRAAREQGREATDDAALVEALGTPVVLVEDSPTNLKVTTGDDLLVADALARATR
jgi:2-C-methyl-D-erythritol 4-phosphate cytidylyltransferase